MAMTWSVWSVQCLYTTRPTWRHQHSFSLIANWLASQGEGCPHRAESVCQIWVRGRYAHFHIYICNMYGNISLLYFFIFLLRLGPRVKWNKLKGEKVKKVKVLIWYSTILYVLYIFGGTLQPNPQQGTHPPWYESSPWGDSDQHAAYIPHRASASAVLPYIFAGTHFTYPQKDGRLSQPVECSTPGPSHVSHYGAMLAGQSPIYVLTGLMIA